MNKKKIINDPVYGFISIPYAIIFDLIEHPYFQRLRYIQQLGLTSLVFPGALHTRFYHAIGATHLMTQTIETLRAKKVKITKQEAKAATIAILMHDIGHGPFSHTLEHTLLNKVHHEELSLLFMQKLNQEFKGKLDLAIEIFKGNYHKKFLHDLVSSQLDMDRLDYLSRDSFFTGVREGYIGLERIIKMLNVKDNHIVVEAKGIYTVEQFLIARRLMYWQVYLHKTVVCAEIMLIKILERAKYLAQSGKELFASPALQSFLQNNYTLDHFKTDEQVLNNFASLGDPDIYAAMRVWQNHCDFVLSDLSQRLLYRRLLKVKMSNQPFDKGLIESLTKQTMTLYGVSRSEAAYFVFTDASSNSVYTYKGSQINIMYKNGTVKNISEASDYQNIANLARPVTKYFLCYPKELRP